MKNGVDRRRQRRGGTSRRGMALLMVLALIGVLAVVLTAMLMLTAQDYGLVRRHRSWLQAYWLSESGIERAAARLEADPTYAGETWQVDPAELGGGGGGVVLIRTERIGDPTGGGHVLVHVQADFPREPEHRVRVGKSVRVDLRQVTGAKP